MPVQLPLAGLELPFDAAPIADCALPLWSYPQVPHQVLSQQAKLLGLAGEYLVDSMLLRYGLFSQPLPEVLPADRLVFHPEGLLRLQIKTSSSRRAGAYHFSLHKGYQRGPTGIKPYAKGDFDLVALVVLPENVMRFTTCTDPHQRIFVDEIPGLRNDPRASLEMALLGLGILPGADFDFLAQP